MKDHSIKDEKVMSQSSNEVTVQFTIPASCDFFMGHFPQFALLPAVAQFWIVSYFCKKYLFANQSVGIPTIKRVKFASPVRPQTLVDLSLSFNQSKNTVSYSLLDATKTDKIYSSGNFSVKVGGNNG